MLIICKNCIMYAHVAQLGERQTEDLKVLGSIPSVGILFLQQSTQEALNLPYSTTQFFLIYFDSLVSKENKKKRSSVDLSHLSPVYVGAPAQCVIILICTAYNLFHVVNDGERVEKYSIFPSGKQNTYLTLWQKALYIESTQHIRVTITKNKGRGIDYSGPLVQWYDSRFGCERSRVQFPHGPSILLTFIL